jgi:hypothetical protein
MRINRAKSLSWRDGIPLKREEAREKRERTGIKQARRPLPDNLPREPIIYPAGVVTFIRFTCQERGPLTAVMSKYQCLRALVAEPNRLEDRLFLANVTMPPRSLPKRLWCHRRTHCRCPRRRRDPGDWTDCIRDGSHPAPPRGNRAPLYRAGGHRRLPRDAWTFPYWRAIGRLGRSFCSGRRCLLAADGSTFFLRFPPHGKPLRAIWPAPNG